jgi:hypothetical protein
MSTIALSHKAAKLMKLCDLRELQAPQRSPKGFGHGQHLSCDLYDGRLRLHD